MLVDQGYSIETFVRWTTAQQLFVLGTKLKQEKKNLVFDTMEDYQRYLSGRR